MNPLPIRKVLLGLSAALVVAAALGPGSAHAAPRRAAVDGAIALVFLARPAADGSGRILPGESRAPVTLRFVSPPTAVDLATLQAVGAELALGPGGAPLVLGPWVAARLSQAAIEKVAALSRVERVSLDGSPFGSPRPLDVTAAEVQAQAAWRGGRVDETDLAGAGVTICDIDSGVDHFHPMFFRPDAGYFDWLDVDGDGVFRPGIDAVDLGAGPRVLRVLQGVVRGHDGAPWFGTGGPGFEVGVDWLYADDDGDGARGSGPEGGYGEAEPAYGEPLFVVDDVDGDGRLGIGERLVRLGTSKVRAVRIGNKTYRRGVDLVNAPVPEDASHGTGASGVLVGGSAGFGKFVGVAPDADLVMVKLGDEFVAPTLACIKEGARVVLHEYAPWVGHHLDGSSPIEQIIDETTAGEISHVNPAGNLSTADKQLRRTLPAGEGGSVLVEVPAQSPYGPFRFLGASLLWRDTSRALAFVLEDPTGFSAELDLTGAAVVPWHSGLLLYARRDDSARGTARVDVFLFGSGDDPAVVPEGTWSLHVADPAPASAAPIELVAFCQDDRSGWARGIHFPEHVSEDHLIGLPATADLGMAIAAYVGNGFQTGAPGERAYYSGRGHRVDGAPILWLSAPADPVSSGYRPDLAEAAYMLYGGTSGASPHVAGAAALLFQADPGRTGIDVREALRAGALADSHVGAAPNDDWGHGKLRIHRSLFGQDPAPNEPPTILVEPVSVLAGQRAVVPFVVSDPEDGAAALVVHVDRDYDGVYDERLETPELEVEHAAPGLYVSKLRVRDTGGKTAVALARVTVLLPEDELLENPLGQGLVAGGGCAQIGPRLPLGGASWLGALGAACALASSSLRRRFARGSRRR